ncbi:hypothetical protein P152DRAFT_411020 [Eremomyces bilateralis CBS 781.70]|uniref:Membrane fusion mating protein FIG1 n=1 Tax=Eremomyces bilateralis CBS 781.70 TaxID=1392243 RepID=A0A6G1GCL7_9PEZI|nr:uncharacterized protein P152DRAFT_411020 [Eremomyces bilateralis CBS 781.70]KAF1815827.1 hypothetical protein P152DRAFT_411020 [Eremomyces bilateralis CBS 781.70]
MAMRFPVSLLRLVPWLGYHHMLMFILSVSIILLSILLAGCSSYSTMIGIYVLGIRYAKVSSASSDSQANPSLVSTIYSVQGNATLDVRVGYFGICVRQSGVAWVCSSSGPALVEQVGADRDPLNLIWLADRFKSDTLFSGFIFLTIALAFITVGLLYTFPGWHSEIDQVTGSAIDVKPFPSRPVSHAAVVLSCIATLMSLVSSLWQHTAAVAAKYTIQAVGFGTATTGGAAMAIGWASVVLLCIVAIGLIGMVISIIVLDTLTASE